MELIILLLGLSLLGAAGILWIRAATFGRTRAVKTMGNIDAYGYATGGSVEDRAPSIVGELASRLGGPIARRVGPGREAEIWEQLVAAGMYDTPARRFLGYRLLLTIVGPLVWLWVQVTGGGSPAFVILTLPVVAAAGWYIPMRYIKIRAQRRLKKIEYDLPELIDLLVVTIEAGLSFSSSLQIATERLGGPLGQELRLALQEQSMGLGMDEALRNFLRRCDTSAVQSFVRAVLQGETLGASIGQIMRSLAIEMRKRRRAAAEERAQKAPVKILFPLVFLIFPAMFIVILAPALFDFLKTFSSG